MKAIKTVAAALFLAGMALMFLWGIANDPATAGTVAGVALCAAVVWLIGKVRR